MKIVGTLLVKVARLQAWNAVLLQQRRLLEQENLSLKADLAIVSCQLSEIRQGLKQETACMSYLDSQIE